MLALLSPERQATLDAHSAARSARSALRFARHPDARMDLLRCLNCGHVYAPCQLRAGTDLGHAADGSRATQLYAQCGCSYTEHGAEPHQKSDVGPQGWPHTEHVEPLRAAALETLAAWIGHAPAMELEALLAAQYIAPVEWPRPHRHLWHEALAPLKPHHEAYRVLFSLSGHWLAAGRLYNLIVEHRVCEGRQGRRRCGLVLDADLLRKSEALDGRRYCRHCRPVDLDLARLHPELFPPWAAREVSVEDPETAHRRDLALRATLRAQCLTAIRETGEPFPGAGDDRYRALTEAHHGARSGQIGGGFTQ
jgi:hypothetical protein